MQHRRPKTSGWDSPFLLLGVLVLGVVLVVLLLLAKPTQSPERLQDLWLSLSSELVGFVVTAGAIGWFLKRHEDHRRTSILKHHLEVVAIQSSRTYATLKPLLAGRDALGPQYLPDLIRTITTLERLEADCAAVVTHESDPVVANKWAEFQKLCRDVLIQLALLQSRISGPPHARITLPDKLAELITKWQENGRDLALIETTSGSAPQL